MSVTTSLRRHLLIVDDEEDLCDFLVAAVSDMGYDVTPFAKGQDLLARLASTSEAQPHAVLSDIRMPGMGGIELLTKMRAAGNNTPVIFLTGYGFIETIIDAVRLGATDFLLKPCDLAEIEMTVTRALEIGFRQQQAATVLHSLVTTYPAAKSDLEKFNQLSRNEVLMKAFNAAKRAS